MSGKTIIISCLTIIILLICGNIQAQLISIYGTVNDELNMPIKNAIISTKDGKQFVKTDAKGYFKIENILISNNSIVAFAEQKNLAEMAIVEGTKEYNFTLSPLSIELDAIKIQAQREKTFGITRLKSVENFGIYESKKTEVIVLADITANLSTNNARQVFAKVAGLNIWESDGVGLQLGIGGRGLSPNRTANFNTRQNGYDISADALGYPESYYTPPVEALEKIEVVRGAASLQYGTQFGGMLNFRFKKAPVDKKISFTSRNTLGSWNYLGTFNSLAGTVGKFSYYTFYQGKKGEGWRPNSNFNVNTFYAQAAYTFNEKLNVNVEYTKMYYLAKQAGGLTDKLFEENPRQSLRSRNWFKVDWNLASLSFNYDFSDRLKFNSRTFGLAASRATVGNLERINVDDRVVINRTVINGLFNNIGNETRLLYRYGSNNLLVGVRSYKGITTAQQGNGSDGNDANFSYLNPENLEGSDFNFPNYNYSFFVENIFNINPKWSITPGIRLEKIITISNGYYKQRVLDFAGNVIVDTKLEDNQRRERNFIIAGLGTSYRPSDNSEVYANFSQNYRAINFSDLRIVNPNFSVDPNLKDERGFTADLGIRGNKTSIYNYDLSAFIILYRGKIGQVLRADQPPLYIDYRLRKNVADARNIGLELFGELNLFELLPQKNKQTSLSIFTNTALVHARYFNTEDASINNKKVEMVPPLIFRSGISYRYKTFSSTLQISYTAEHFSDATNAVRTSTAVEGIIPAYKVMDFSMAYSIKRYKVEGTINNVLNEKYFTRRAESYPGPGIIPSDPRAFYITLAFTL